MPLKKGFSKKTISKNIEELVGAGHAPNQAAAIAHSVAGDDIGVSITNPPACAGIMLVSSEGKILLMQRSPGRVQGGTWAFPGGHVEPGEFLDAAAIRECAEETGFMPDLITAVDFTACPDHTFTLYAAQVDEFVPVMCDEHSAYVWADPQDLPAPLHPGVADSIAKVFYGTTMAGDDSARIADVNGWVEIADNPIARVGVFDYYGATIGVTDDPQGIYKVYQSAEELGDPECVKSFRLVPWVDNHTNLGPSSAGLTPAEKKGIQGVTGENVYFDGEYLRANLKVFSESFAGEIDAGKRELSIGYRCKFVYSPGVWNGIPYDYVKLQIRGNHLALVDDGRCGPSVMVLDHDDINERGNEMPIQNAGLPAKKPVILPVARVVPAVATRMHGDADDAQSADLKISDVLDMLKTVAPALQQIAALQASLGGAPAGADPDLDGDEDGDMGADKAPPQAAAGTAPTTPQAATQAPASVAPVEPPKKDPAEALAGDAAEVAKLRAKLAELEAKRGPSMTELMQEIGKRDTLARRLSGVVGAFDHAEMTTEDVAKYGAEKLGLQCSAGSEAVAVAAYLDGMGKSAPVVHAGDAATVKPAKAGRIGALDKFIKG